MESILHFFGRFVHPVFPGVIQPAQDAAGFHLLASLDFQDDPDGRVDRVLLLIAAGANHIRRDADVLGVDRAHVAGARRSDFALPEDAFLFLVMYDMRSYQARKNPDAAIAAFERAFADGKQAALVVKINNGQAFPGDLARLQERMKGNPGIRLIDQRLTRQQVYDLESVCDAFLSLHRSEGFGLGLAESMFLGKPAVGTNWSGNTDFMDARNSCPVDCTLVTLAEDCGPYKAGERWAEPDIDHAAWYMRKLVDDPAWRRRIAEAGRKTITEEFSAQAVGQSYCKRLDVIFRLLAGERR